MVGFDAEIKKMCMVTLTLQNTATSPVVTAGFTSVLRIRKYPGNKGGQYIFTDYKKAKRGKMRIEAAYNILVTGEKATIFRMRKK